MIANLLKSVVALALVRQTVNFTALTALLIDSILSPELVAVFFNTILLSSPSADGHTIGGYADGSGLIILILMKGHLSIPPAETQYLSPHVLYFFPLSSLYFSQVFLSSTLNHLTYLALKIQNKLSSKYFYLIASYAVTI